MTWLFLRVLLPALRVTYLPFDALLGWTLYLPTAAAVAVVGTLSGLAVNLIQKYCSDQALLAQAKADLKRLKELRRTALEAEDAETALRLSMLSRRIGGSYFRASMVPALLTVPIIGIVAMWAASRMGSRALRPDETVDVRAHFEDGASGFAHFVPNSGLQPIGPVVVPVEVPRGEEPPGVARASGQPTPRGREARWRLRVASEGKHPFVVRHAGGSYKVEVPVSRRAGRPPDRITVFDEGTPSRDRLQAVEFMLAPTMPKAWWNLLFQWAGLYVLTALASGIALRFALGVS